MVTPRDVERLVEHIAIAYHHDVLRADYPKSWSVEWAALSENDRQFIINTVRHIVYVVLAVDTALVEGVL